MATLAPKATVRAKPSGSPLLVHPAFPAVVALWFAALLGLGSLILPDALFNSGVEATGIASVIPAAAPPLGGFARTIIALVAALIGAGLGLILTRQVAKSLLAESDESNSASDNTPDKPKRGLFSNKKADDAPRPINAHEELGQEGFGRSESATEGDWTSGDEDTSYALAAPTPVPVTTSVAGAAIAAALTQDDEPAEVEVTESSPEIDEPEADVEHDTPEGITEDKPAELTEAAQCLALAKTGEETGAPDWQQGSLKDLSLLHLTQRLASSFERRREWRTSQGRPVFAQEMVQKMVPASGFDAALEEDAENARANFFASPSDTASLAPSTAPLAAAPIGLAALTGDTIPAEQGKPLKDDGNEDALREALKKLQGFSGIA